jgi:hypothetical protein
MTQNAIMYVSKQAKGKFMNANRIYKLKKILDSSKNWYVDESRSTNSIYIDHDDNDKSSFRISDHSKKFFGKVDEYVNDDFFERVEELIDWMDMIDDTCSTIKAVQDFLNNEYQNYKKFKLTSKKAQKTKEQKREVQRKEIESHLSNKDSGLRKVLQEQGHIKKDGCLKKNRGLSFYYIVKKKWNLVRKDDCIFLWNRASMEAAEA